MDGITRKVELNRGLVPHTTKGKVKTGGNFGVQKGGNSKKGVGRKGVDAQLRFGTGCDASGPPTVRHPRQGGGRGGLEVALFFMLGEREKVNWGGPVTVL